jgi:hypothetical protein
LGFPLSQGIGKVEEKMEIGKRKGCLEEKKTKWEG